MSPPPPPTATSPLVDTFGALPLIVSSSKHERTFVDVRELSAASAADGAASASAEGVWVRARVHAVRDKSKLAFVVLRQKGFTVQCVVAERAELVRFAASLHHEQIVDVLARCVQPPKPITATTQSDVELHALKVFLVADADARPPLLVEDAARNPDDAAKAGLVYPDQSTRLDNRVIDLRTPGNQAIFAVQAAVGRLFREFLLERRFVEIHSPKLISAATEGGASVFALKYFNRPAFMAQSPQFYKQMAIAGDLDRVFEIGPVFRAENANTHRHLTEYVGLDLEMAFMRHYHEVLDVIAAMLEHIFERLPIDCAAELKVIGAQHPFEPLVVKRPLVRMTFADAHAMLVAHAGKSGDAELDRVLAARADTDDLSTPEEKLLGRLVRAAHDTDVYIVDKFPAAVRPFYTMLDAHDEKWSNSYDIFVRGEEISSGAQRVHDAATLERRIESKGLRPADFKDYVSAFRYGCAPHAGAGIGLERLVMLYLGIGNVRKTSLFPRDPSRVQP